MNPLLTYPIKVSDKFTAERVIRWTSSCGPPHLIPMRIGDVSCAASNSHPPLAGVLSPSLTSDVGEKPGYGRMATQGAGRLTGKREQMGY